MPVLLQRQASPIALGHVAHMQRLVVGVGDVVGQFDRPAGVVEVELAVECGIENTDEAGVFVVDRGAERAFICIAQHLAHPDLPGQTAQRRINVDQQQGEKDIEDEWRGDDAQASQSGIEQQCRKKQADRMDGECDQRFRQSGRETQKCQHLAAGTPCLQAPSETCVVNFGDLKGKRGFSWLPVRPPFSV